MPEISRFYGIVIKMILTKRAWAMSHTCFVWRAYWNLWFADTRYDGRRFAKASTRTCQRLDETKSKRIAWNVE